MRSAIVATPALLPDLRPAPGALDGDLIRARLPLPDADFRVIDLDPGRDLAEQLDILFDTSAPPPGSPIMFYASCSVALAVDGELFLCLDPANPQTGDSLKDIAVVLRDRHEGPLLLIVECRHAPEAEDPFRSAAIVEAAKAAIEKGSGVELLVAAHPIESGDEDLPSPFTRAFVEALDDADPATGLSVQVLFEELRYSSKLVGLVPAFTYVRGKSVFELIPASEYAPKSSPGDTAKEAEASGAASSGKAPGASALEETPAAAPVAPSEPPQDDGARSARSRLRSHMSISDEVAVLGGDEQDMPPVSLPPMSLPPESIPVHVSFETTGVVTSPLEDGSLLETTGSVPVSFEATGSVNVSFEATGSVNVSLDSLGSPMLEALAEPTFADHLAKGDRLAEAKDLEAALREFKNALGHLTGDATRLRAEIYLRIANVKTTQDKRREAIAHIEKALQVLPSHRKAIESLVDLTFREEDWPGLLAAEERLFAIVTDPDELFPLLVSYAERWGGVALDAERARALLERARGVRPADKPLLSKLGRLYSAIDLTDEALEARRRLAELTDDAHERAREYLSIGRYCLEELKREPLALELFDAALDSDPTNIEPLTIVEHLLEERQEWSELEQILRRMIERLDLCPKGKARTEVSWDISRRLAFLYRDHLEDPGSALLSFQDAISHKPDDLDSHCVAAELARTTGRLEQAATHLQAIAVLDPTTMSTFHDLFEVFQKLRRPDQAYAAACVTAHLQCADARERIIFEEHIPEGPPPFSRALREDAWALLRVADNTSQVESILSAVSSAAVAAKIALLEEEGRLPTLDQAARQDPQTSPVSIVRSFVWGSHFLGVPAPSVYLRDGAAIGLAAVMAAEPSVVIGNLVLRGRTMSELAFLVGRHLAYHVGSHRLLLYYPSLDELSVCFLASLRVAIPSLPVPSHFREAVVALSSKLEGLLAADDVKRIQRAVAELDASGKPADITRWVSGVEHCASRAGYVLCGNLDVASQIMRAEPLGMVPSADKVNGIVSFTVSEAYYSLRQELGVALEP